MTLLLKGGAVFLHVPKTGGLWVTEVLEGLGLVERSFAHIHADAERALRYLEGSRTIFHDTWLHAKSRAPHRLKYGIRRKVVTSRREEVDRSPFMFAFVRDPLDWYASYWRYQCDMNWLEYGNRYDVHDWHPWVLLNGLGSPDFNQFIRNVIDRRPGYVTEMYGWYTLPTVNFVGHTESLAADLVAVLRMLDVRFDEDKVLSWKPKNVSKGRGRVVQWDPELRLEMERLEYAARRRFGYAAAPSMEPSRAPR